ncbi:MAG TPA: hypothetical protein ENN96_00420 [Candidatus Acetothermia bacterium]|nr:hypothetical protein [Candidatus Acetothermia bacterium]
MSRLTEVVCRQYAAAWSLLSEGIDAVEEAGWKTGESSYAVPARIAYHAIETADYYTHPNLAEFVWAERFGVDWEAEDAQLLPGRDEIRLYLEDVRKKAERWLTAQGEVGLLVPDEVFHQEGMTHLDRALYVLRHTQQHIGELFSILRARGISRPGWR